VAPPQHRARRCHKGPRVVTHRSIPGHFSQSSSRADRRELSGCLHRFDPVSCKRSRLQQ
jgi:hypothetical protein